MTSTPKRAVYDELGIEPIINAAGTFTDLGGSLMSAEVVEAWNQAARSFVDLNELQHAVATRIAKLLQVEAALVTGGAASSILLGTAAAITRHNPDFVHQQRCPARPYEVLRQKKHRDLYDRQIETCGVNIVEVESPEDVKRSVNDRTVLMVAYNIYEAEGKIQHAQWLDLARQHSIPTLLDAAADTPPIANLTHFNKLGYDLVAISGGKAIGGPQGSGLLLGRRALIDAARQNASPAEGTIGRIAKVSKEDMVALWKAIEVYLRDGDGTASMCLARISSIQKILNDVPSLTMQIITPPVANHFPHLLLHWDEVKVGVNRDEVKKRLLKGSPRIATARVHGTGKDGFLISVVNLQAGEAEMVGARLREILTGTNRIQS